MSLWQLVGISAVGTAASGNLTLTLPASLQANDLLVACITWRDSPTFAVPTTGGWQNCGASATAANTTNNATGSISGTRMDYLVRGGSDPSGTDLVWPRTAGNQARGYILAYRRTDGGTPVFEQASALALAAASANFSGTGLTTTEENELLVMACGAARTSGTTNQLSAEACATDPLAASWSEHADSGTTTSATCALAVASAVKATPGATGNFQFTSTGSARHSGVLGRFRAKYNIAPATGSYALTGQSVGEGDITYAVLSGTQPFDESSGTFLIEDVPLSTEDPDRIILVSAQIQLAEISSGVFVQLEDVRIGGVSMTLAPNEIDTGEVPDSGGRVIIGTWVASAPTGTTGDLEFDTDTPGGAAILLAGVIAVYGADPTPVDADAVLDTSGDGTVAISLDGVDLGRSFYFTFGDVYVAAPRSTTWSGAQEIYDTEFAPGFVNSMATHWFINAGSAYEVTTDDDQTGALFNSKFLTGISLGPLGAGAVLIAEAASFTLTGQTAGGVRTYRLVAEHATYALSGQDVILRFGRPGPSDFGSYTYTGQDVSFIVPRLFPDAGIYEYFGQDLDFIVGQILSVDFAVFTLFGQDASLEYHQHGQWYEENPDTDSWVEETSLIVTWTEEASLLNTWTEES